jgi:hypothetical protein
VVIGDQTEWIPGLAGLTPSSLSATRKFVQTNEFMWFDTNDLLSNGDHMNTTTMLKLFAISLAFIFIIAPVTAGVFGQLDGLIRDKSYTRESTKLSGYIGSSQYSLLEPKFSKPDLGGFADLSIKPKSDLAKIGIIEKDLWQSIPTTGPYCPTCGFNNATKSFGSMFSEEYKSPLKGYFFGGSAAGAGASGGCGC